MFQGAQVYCLVQNVRRKNAQENTTFFRYGAECRFKSKSTYKFKHEKESNNKEILSYNEKEKEFIAETKYSHKYIKQLLENAEKQKLYISVIEAECSEAIKKLTDMGKQTP